MSTDNKIYPKPCPICRVPTNYLYRLNTQDGVSTEWYRCNCGVIFQSEFPKLSTYDKEYVNSYLDPQTKTRNEHLARTYAPVIESIIHGRKMLDVGFTVPTNMEFFNKRGWITWGIDNAKPICGHDNIYKGDFEEFNFDIKLNKEQSELLGLDELKKQFDVIWMGNVFSSFKNPLKVLSKCYDLLPENGVMFLNVPDVDFITKCGLGEYPNFKGDENYILWNRDSIVRELERLNFDVVVCRRNFSASYLTHYDVHIVCQKKYF